MLREEHRLRLSESRVLRRIIGLKREAMASWKKLLDENVHKFYSSPSMRSIQKVISIYFSQIM
jgi:hypothetical protein